MAAVAFSGIRVSIPASAVPGTHYITAVAHIRARSAQARFLVNTNRAQFGYSASHSGLNPWAIPNPRTGPACKGPTPAVNMCDIYG